MSTQTQQTPAAPVQSSITLKYNGTTLTLTPKSAAAEQLDSRMISTYTKKDGRTHSLTRWARLIEELKRNKESTYVEYLASKTEKSEITYRYAESLLRLAELERDVYLFSHPQANDLHAGTKAVNQARQTESRLIKLGVETIA
jgi:hypothetical protein